MIGLSCRHDVDGGQGLLAEQAHRCLAGLVAARRPVSVPVAVCPAARAGSSVACRISCLVTGGTAVA
ncbi:hypothetical protein ACFXAZ_04235 [Streptomyces sp. NPDC059477]|uniref:hypothetical protein n=1 Tax=Streptomyces sp. NPDC059477 TaxID=3346847 RepID=UPI0036C9DB32